MASDDTPRDRCARLEALQDLAASAVHNIPSVDFASITLAEEDQTLHTVAATDPLAERLDAVQYELREGPCYAAVNDERLILINDVARTSEFPRYGPRAAETGVRSQVAIQLLHDRERAGLNLYARSADAFDRETLHLAELVATHATGLLSYVEQVEQLGEALHTRTDIGTAVGIVMERYGIDRDQAFGFLVRHSNHGNIKIRDLAQQIIAGTFVNNRPGGTADAPTRPMSHAPVRTFHADAVAAATSRAVRKPGRRGRDRRR